MLRRVIKTIIVLLLFSCGSRPIKNERAIKETSKRIVGTVHYDRLILLINDSINLWKENNLRDYAQTKGQSEYIVDSLICVNSEGNRLIGCFLERTFIKPKPTGGLTYLYGEKINNGWYFFSGPHYFLPNEMNEDKSGSPYTYSRLHQIALKEIYSGYLTRNGEINEDWFLHHFEDSGWGDFNNQKASDFLIKGKRFTNKRAFFECIRLECVRNNWRSRDTTQPIKSLPTQNNP